MELLNICSSYSSISIIGMGKNVGKTTALNHIINEAREQMHSPLGLTSIGWDGECEDQVTLNSKPRIYVEKGTIIATSRRLLKSCDITKEIVFTTGMQTPMGEVIIVRALSDGYVELGGPSINSQVAELCQLLKDLGCQLTIVDGALDRRTSASPVITEGTILSTGASLSRSMHKAVELTAHAVELLSTPKEENVQILNLAENIYTHSRMGIIDKHCNVNLLDVKTSLGSVKELTEALNEDSRVIVIKGVVQDSMLDGIMQSLGCVKNLKIIAEDGTKLFITPDMLYRFTKRGGFLRAMAPINLLCITCNPCSPHGYKYNRDEFIERLEEKISLPIIDVIGGGHHRLFE
jgi:hypothetical protein